MPAILLAAVIGALIGLSLGMLGGGGSILTVPALVYILGQDAHAAVSASLVIVGLNALTGAWLHQRAGNVRLRSALFFGGTGLLAAFAGARLSTLLSGAVLLVLFALLMLVVATMMLRGAASASVAVHDAPLVWWKLLLGGTAVGFLTGFLGVGGGFLIVPALVLVLGMSMLEAGGSSLVVIAINSTAGLLGHLGETGVSWLIVGVLLAGGLPGLFMGTRLARRLPVTRLRQGFAVLVIVLSVTLLAINIPKALG